MLAYPAKGVDATNCKGFKQRIPTQSIEPHVGSAPDTLAGECGVYMHMCTVGARKTLHPSFESKKDLGALVLLLLYPSTNAFSRVSVCSAVMLS